VIFDNNVLEKKKHDRTKQNQIYSHFFFFFLLRSSYLFTPMSFAGLEKNAMIELPVPY
jgi:hypothetical protein